MREVVKLGIILFLITGICVGLLGAVNQLTTPIIEANNLKAEQDSMKQLLSEADSFVQVKNLSDENVKKVFVGMKSNQAIGYVVNVESQGYGGTISLLVAMDTNKVIKGVKILGHSETPGFGANAEKPSYINQYIGKQGGLQVVKVSPKEDEIQAITGATITSAAITEGVNSAIAFVENQEAEWRDVQ